MTHPSADTANTADVANTANTAAVADVTDAVDATAADIANTADAANVANAAAAADTVAVADAADTAAADTANTAAANANAAAVNTANTAPASFDSFDSLLCAAAPFDAPPSTDDALAEILYTFGPTGQPKGCLLTHRAACMSAMTAALGLAMHRDDRMLVAMPLWHSAPLNNFLLGTLYVCGTVVLLREYHPLAFLQTAQNERITLYFGAPVSFLLPLQAGIDIASFDLRAVRAWVYGGGPIGADTARELARLYRSDRFYQVYGMTETGPLGTCLYPEEQIAKVGSIGRVAVPGVDMRVVRADGADARAGETGEIWLKSR